MRLKTMELMGWNNTEILRNLRRQLRDTEGKIRQFQRRIKLGSNDKALGSNYASAIASAKQLADEIAKRENQR